MKETEEMSKAEDSELWTMKYETINRLRILNKYHFEIVTANIHLFQKFIASEIVNLRSNNSKNALTLMVELFQN